MNLLESLRPHRWTKDGGVLSENFSSHHYSVFVADPVITRISNMTSMCSSNGVPQTINCGKLEIFDFIDEYVTCYMLMISLSRSKFNIQR